MLLRWLIAFVFTELVEVPIYLRALDGAGARSRLRRVLFALGASALTHPWVWFAFPRLPFAGLVPMLVTAETFAVGVEAVYLRLLRVPRPLAWSLAANASSFGLGLVSHFVFGLP
jgi:hypothetical protein